MEKHFLEEKNFRLSKSVLDLSHKHKTHIEFGSGFDLYGFDHNDNIKSQNEKANELFFCLTQQEKYFFFITAQFDKSHHFTHFVNAKNIILTNDEEILSIRGMSSYKKKTPVINQSFKFDISKIKNSLLFYKEINSLFKWLGLECPTRNRLNDLRLKFVRNLQVPIRRPKPTWNGKGWFKGNR